MRHPNSMTPAEIDAYRASFTGHGTREDVTRIEVTGGVVYVRERAATAFVGKSLKPAFHYSFRSNEHRDRHVAAWTERMDAAAKAKATRAQERRDVKHGLMKGTILSASWGYEQTNVDFYEVVRVISDKTVEIRQIASEMVSRDSAMSGHCMPCPGRYIGEVMRKRANQYGLRLTSYSSASVWNGKPEFCSSWA